MEDLSRPWKKLHGAARRLLRCATVNDIAFRPTFLLSSAWRQPCREQGRGFAVVAAEVRNWLVARRAAKEIEKRIKDSIAGG